MSFQTGITRTFDQAYYGGTASADSGAGTNYDIVLGGRPYMLDWQPPDPSMAFQFETLPLLQRYFLTQETGNIGEQTLNPLDYWRRSADTWNAGQGQKYNDRTNSNREQYRLSSGIDPWTIGQISLLPATTNLFSTTDVCYLAVTSDHLYILDIAPSSSLSFATSLSSFSMTAVTAGAGDAALSNATSLASDGTTVYLTDANRVHYSGNGDTNFHPYHASDHIRDFVRTAKGRVFTAAGNTLYTNTGAAGSAVEAVLLAHPNPNFKWVDVAPGPSAIYFAGHAGSQSLIYSTQVVSDGTNLNVPAVAAEIPEGEQVTAISSYLGVLLIGTTKGVRIAPMDASGNLTLEGLILTDGAVFTFEPQERFVWFGGSNDGTMRMDLSVFNGNVPAYAGDLVGTPGDGSAVSIVTFAGKRVFAQFNTGVWCEATDGSLVPTGTLYQGWWNYSLPDRKQAVKLVLQYEGNGGSITLATAADFSTTYLQAGGVVTSSGNQAASATLITDKTSGVIHEVRLTLARDPVDTTMGPVITRYTLMSNPQPQRRITITVPLQLHSKLETYAQNTVTVDPAAERAIVDGWCQSNQIITYQDAASTYAVTVDDYHWLAYAEVGSRRSLDGTLAVKLKIIN